MLTCARYGIVLGMLDIATISAAEGVGSDGFADTKASVIELS